MGVAAVCTAQQAVNILTGGQTSESSSQREDANFARSSQGSGSVCPFVSFLVSCSKSDRDIKDLYIFSSSEYVTYLLCNVA